MPRFRFDLRQISLIIAFILTTILLALMIYYVFFKAPPAEIALNINEGVPGQLPEAGKLTNREPVNFNVNAGLPAAREIPLPAEVSPIAQGGSTAVGSSSPSIVWGLQPIGDGTNFQYYDKISGKFYRLDDDGGITALSDQLFHDVEKITWASDNNKAILEYPDGSNIIYNFATGEQITLAKHWKDFDFSPTADKIVAKSIGLDVENRYLITAKTDGTKAKIVEYLGEAERTVQVDWSPNNQIVAAYTAPLDGTRQKLYFIGQNQENFKSTVVEGRGFESQWSLEGDRLLYSVYNSQSAYNPNLWIVQASGENIGSGRKSLKLNTWAKKCAFATNTTVYCGVPQSLPTGAGLYPSLANNTSDDIYKIDLETGFKTKVAEPYGNYTVDTLSISSNGRYLYFVDKQTGKLFKIQLK